MIKSLEKLNKKLEDIQKKLPNMRSDAADEQLLLNKKTQGYVDELTEVEDGIFEMLKNRTINLMPTEPNPVTEELFKESESYRQVMKMLGKDEEFIERFGFDRTIYEVGNAKDVNRVNHVIRDFIKDMRSIGIVLQYDNFNYSSFTLKYMKKFFEEMENENSFTYNMRKTFDNIYWECPKLLTHLELCIRGLVNNNKRIIIKHINHLLNKSLVNVNCTLDNLVDKYVKTRIQYEEMRDTDAYNIIEYFKTHRDTLPKYMTPSVQFDQVLSTVTDTDKFYRANQEERIYIFKNINDLYYAVKEYEAYDKFKYIYDYLDDIFAKKETFKGVYQAKLKEITALERVKNKLDKKVNFLISRRKRVNENNKSKLNDLTTQIKELNVELDKKIAEIKEAYEEANDMRFKEMVGQKLMPSSTIYEVTLFLSRFYSLLYNLIEKNNKDYDDEQIYEAVDEFRHIQYSAHLDIFKSISFLELDRLKELIENKFNLYGINASIPSTSSGEYANLLENLTTLMRFNNLEMLSLKPEDVDIMLKVNDKL